MKKSVLCFFSLILYLLTACTILSQKIEKEMATLVQIELRTTSGSASPTSQSMDVLFTDDNGQHLYEVIDGTGWEQGLRIQEIPADVWDIGYTRFGPYVEITGGRDYRFVESASRHPPDGRLAEIIEQFETVDDQYLAIYSGPVPEIVELPENAEIAAQSGNTLLLDVKKAELPFLEHKVKTLSATLGAADRVFSMAETAQFLEELPAVAMLFTTLTAGLILWGFSCCLSIRARENKLLIWINTALAVASLGFMLHTLNGIDLPASLLPAENIFDWQHYAENYSLIFDSLESLSGVLPDLMTAKMMAVDHASNILYCGTLLVFSLILVESILLYIKAFRSKHKK